MLYYHHWCYDQATKYQKACYNVIKQVGLDARSRDRCDIRLSRDYCLGLQIIGNTKHFS